MKIVLADLKMAEQIAEIEKKCFANPWSINAVTEQMSNKSSSFFVAIDDAENVLGYIGIEIIIDEGYILNIAVLPEFRKKKIATQLLNKALDTAEEKSLSFLTLEVRASNEIAKEFYFKNGFLEVAKRKNYYKSPVDDAILMTRFFEKNKGEK